MLFYANASTNRSVNYEEFFNKLGRMRECPKYIYTKDTLEIIENVVFAMLNGLDIVLLDGDFTNVELSSLGVTEEKLNFVYKIDNPIKVTDIDEFRNKVMFNQDITHIGIYTSGTTGLPKRFDHNLRSLLRNIKMTISHKDDVWAFAYNITHFAGIQVLLQGILNFNSIIDVFGNNSKQADSILKCYRCNCISATPTYYRNFLLSISDSNEIIKSVTFGGEKFSDDLLGKIKSKFPNAKVRNVYASTEVGSLLAGSGESFSIPKSMYNLIKISEDNHLLLHRSIVYHTSVETEWYDTSDIVRLNTDGTFKFMSRDSDFINVGGYKVNPHEVENIILEVPGVVDVAVYGRDNSVTGKILAADIIVREGFDDKTVKIAITQKVRSSLQAFKVPRILKVVDEIKKSRSGKKVR